MPGKIKKIEKVQDSPPSNTSNEDQTSFSTTDSDESIINVNQLPYDKETYVLKFGIYKGRRAIDVANDFKIKMNKENESYKDRCGYKYLKFLLEKCEWLHDRDKATISQIVKEYKY